MGIQFQGVLRKPSGDLAPNVIIRFKSTKNFGDMLISSPEDFVTNEFGTYDFRMELGRYSLQVLFNDTFMPLGFVDIHAGLPDPCTISLLLLETKPIEPVAITYAESLLALIQQESGKVSIISADVSSKFADIDTWYADFVIKYADINNKYSNILTKSADVTSKYLAVKDWYDNISIKYADIENWHQEVMEARVYIDNLVRNPDNQFPVPPAFVTLTPYDTFIALAPDTSELSWAGQFEFYLRGTDPNGVRMYKGRGRYVEISGLTPDTQYYFSVRAVNSLGVSEFVEVNGPTTMEGTNEKILLGLEPDANLGLILEQFDRELNTYKDTLIEYDTSIDLINRNQSDVVATVTNSLSNFATRQDEYTSRLLNNENLIDAVVTIDNVTGQIINKAFEYTDSSYAEAGILIDGINSQISLYTNDIELLNNTLIEQSASITLLESTITSKVSYSEVNDLLEGAVTGINGDISGLTVKIASVEETLDAANARWSVYVTTDFWDMNALTSTDVTTAIDGWDATYSIRAQLQQLDANDVIVKANNAAIWVNAADANITSAVQAWWVAGDESNLRTAEQNIDAINGTIDETVTSVTGLDAKIVDVSQKTFELAYQSLLNEEGLTAQGISIAYATQSLTSITTEQAATATKLVELDAVNATSIATFDSINQALVDVNSAVSIQGSELTARVNNVEAQAENYTRAAVSYWVNSQGEPVDTPADVNNPPVGYSKVDGPLAEDIRKLSITTGNGDTASIGQIAQVFENNNGTLVARGGLLVDNNGRVTGFTAYDDGLTSNLDLIGEHVRIGYNDTSNNFVPLLSYDTTDKVLNVVGKLVLTDGHTITSLADIKAEDGLDGVNGSSWHSVTLRNGIFPANSTATADFLSLFGRPPVLDDHFTYLNSNQTASSVKRFNGSIWVSPMAIIHGDLLTKGTISGDRIVANTSINAPIIIGGNITIGSNFSVNNAGNLVASNATISGEINANSGTFNNVIIEDTCTVKGTIFADKIVGDIVSAITKTVTPVSQVTVGNSGVAATVSVVAPSSKLRTVMVSGLDLVFSYNVAVYDVILVARVKVSYGGNSVYSGSYTYSDTTGYQEYRAGTERVSIPNILLSIPANTSGNITIQVEMVSKVAPNKESNNYVTLTAAGPISVMLYTAGNGLA